MDSISEKIKGWIEEGRDARSAHWQGALEKILDLFSPVLEPGKLSPVQELQGDDRDVFNKCLVAMDLSPGLLAAFLPPAIAGAITPPESAAELQRIGKGEPSHKILISRPGDPMRLMVAEVSARADRPGADIFQSGALLGTYDYQNQEDCLAGLTTAIRSHLWEKGSWPRENYRAYTLNWFERVLALGRGPVPVEEKCSYLHSPTRIQSNRIDAIFTLIQDVLLHRLDDVDAGGLAGGGGEWVQEQVAALLNVMREGEMVDFASFSDREAEQFKQEFSATVGRVTRQIMDASG